ncbi:hypothetical protein KBY70_10175 [Cyanobium sp. ATX 6E8]|uniref:phosphotransferase n=1 Tax=Cyanobium sp. ATX 6E8 TaxID=2823701 RepID=UPI0020CF7A1A|nr:hypothetical protein [Cyanobium sp. ATX 6E8]MCP9942754.1 hypothetical protein [Cyanobium sp. ATX 6E8]
MSASAPAAAELTVLVLAGGSLAGKALGPAAPLWPHPLLLSAGSGLAIEVIQRFYATGPLPVMLRVVVDEPPPPAVPLRGLAAEQLLQVAPQAHIIGSLRAALAAVATPWVLVNPITTLPARPAQLACEVQVGEQPLVRENWAAIRPQAGGGWVFEGKGGPPSATPAPPFTGILCAPTAVLAQLAAAVPDASSADLLALAQALVEQAGAAVVAAPWHDLGHRTTHAASRRSRLPSRAFNQLHHCRQRDVIVKRSSDHARLAAERAYLAALPAPLRRHFPALLPGGPGEEGALVMEAVPFPNLAELHLHWDLGPNTWVAILERLAAIQADFAAAAPPQRGSSRWLYSTKLASRWQQVLALGGEAWWQRPLCLNGRWQPPLAEQVQHVLTALQPLEEQSALHLIHGDFCFNNILCDPLYTAIRLIDPRGEAAPGGQLPPGYGDSRYDLVKLFHSIGGHYDAIVNNLFALRWLDRDHLELEIYSPPLQSFVADAFGQILMPAAMDDRELHLLTASLFFSMLPLHREDPERLVALAASGMLMLNAADA